MMSRIFVAGVVALGLASMAAPSFAAETAAPPAASTPPAPAVTLYDVVGELARADAMQREIKATLRETSDWTALKSTLDVTPLAAEYQAIQADRDPVTRVRYMELRALDVHLRERLRAVSGAAAGLGSLAHRVVAELDRLDREAALWPQRSALARERQAPPEVQRSIDAVAPELATLRGELIARRDELLVAYDRAARGQSRIEAARSEMAERRERLWAALRTSASAPIWQPGAVGLPLDELKADSRLMRFELVEYLGRTGERIGTVFVVLAVVLFLLLRRPVAAGSVTEATPPRLSAGIAACGALTVTLPCIALFAPTPAPFIFYRLVWFAFPLLAGAVAIATFAQGYRATAWSLAFAVFLNAFRALAEMSPAADWGLLVLQVVPFGVALVHDWRRGALSHALPHWRATLQGHVVKIEIAVLLVALSASFLGYVGLALGLVALAVIAPGYAMTFSAFAWTLDRALENLLALPLAQVLRSVRERRDAMRRALHGTVVLLAWAAGVATFALSYSALDDLFRVGNYIAHTSVSVGDVTITFSSILAAVAIVALTWLVTKLVRFVLAHELLPRLNLRTGVPVAISTVAGYVLVVTGFVLAMAALGIDLTKVTLLAGAVGVGVGFGLQNIVNNFVSGLILMLERPINVGDQIDVGGGVGGEVRRIGVRSSTIRTSQGAEVIVPNADLAGKQVTNWTLSDRSRRYEIDVRVAYGSDPARVLTVLEAAASIPEVRKKPPPRALFTGFGEGSLDFRVMAWVESVDVGLQAQNNLRIAILGALADAGIAIPFQQHALHIREAPTAPETRAPAARAG